MKEIIKFITSILVVFFVIIVIVVKICNVIKSNFVENDLHMEIAHNGNILVSNSRYFYGYLTYKTGLYEIDTSTLTAQKILVIDEPNVDIKCNKDNAYFRIKIDSEEDARKYTWVKAKLDDFPENKENWEYLYEEDNFCRYVLYGDRLFYVDHFISENELISFKLYLVSDNKECILEMKSALAFVEQTHLMIYSIDEESQNIVYAYDYETGKISPLYGCYDKLAYGKKSVLVNDALFFLSENNVYKYDINTQTLQLLRSFGNDALLDQICYKTSYVYWFEKKSENVIVIYEHNTETNSTGLKAAVNLDSSKLMSSTVSIEKTEDEKTVLSELASALKESVELLSPTKIIEYLIADNTLYVYSNRKSAVYAYNLSTGQSTEFELGKDEELPRKTQYILGGIVIVIVCSIEHISNKTSIEKDSEKKKSDKSESMNMDQ
ncbi:MAG: hypothetical protein E7322_01060 [Clostridiales bacterium]|nr:hypothetical protein [Clostridiales bacterium]